MTQVNMLEAKTDLSKLVRLLETKKEDVIYIARNNRIVAEITLHQEIPVSKRIGAAKGLFTAPDSFDDWDEEVVNMFEDDAV